MRVAASTIPKGGVMLSESVGPLRSREPGEGHGTPWGT